MSGKLHSFFQYIFAAYGMMVKVLLPGAGFDSSGGEDIFALCLRMYGESAYKSCPVKVAI
ncbi:hypothetical protein [Bartonella birtlesii]|uniref:Uncharacterized protein n=1 Tax=Bartonella birtlesii LL-WM9 TaxID=1094552 RepID=J1IXD1_9HYPH|nr:hypothetical protein [Bartonella birtlesii]EJF76332.1 hypothetical protein ME7_00876 [Bartonella birtlesii LL-WM9]